MSVELDVKIGPKLITRDALYREVLLNIRNCTGLDVGLSCELSQSNDGNIGNQPCTIELAIGDLAKVQCLCYSAGTEEELADEGGWWMCISVELRNGSSFLLMLITAVSIAKLVSVDIIDESGMLSSERSISPYLIQNEIPREHFGTFEGAAEAVENYYRSK